MWQQTTQNTILTETQYTLWILSFQIYSNILTTNFSEESNYIMTDSETENSDASVVEVEGNDEGIIKSWKRCTKCKRPTVNHEGKCGQNCKLDLLDEDQMKQYEMSIL